MWKPVHPDNAGYTTRGVRARAHFPQIACDCESRRVAFGSVATARNSRVRSRNNRASFLSHRRRGNSHEIVPDFAIGAPLSTRFSLISRGPRARPCVSGSRRVHVHAPRQFYGANIIAAAVRFPFRRNTHESTRTRTHFLLAVAPIVLPTAIVLPVVDSL